MKKSLRLVALLGILAFTFWIPLAEAYPTPLCTSLHGTSCEVQWSTAWCWNRFPSPGSEGSCVCHEFAPVPAYRWDCV
jgi:hypothetical protein